MIQIFSVSLRRSLVESPFAQSKQRKCTEKTVFKTFNVFGWIFYSTETEWNTPSRLARGAIWARGFLTSSKEVEHITCDGVNEIISQISVGRWKMFGSDI